MIQIRYQLSKVVPMKFHTHYLIGQCTEHGEQPEMNPEPHVCDWWQWRDRAFRQRDRIIGWPDPTGLPTSVSPPV